MHLMCNSLEYGSLDFMHVVDQRIMRVKVPSSKITQRLITSRWSLCLFSESPPPTSVVSPLCCIVLAQYIQAAIHHDLAVT